MTPRRKKVLAVVVPIEVVSAALAWRDLRRRDDAEVRASKRFWRIVMLMNPGNSFVYWLVGRR